VGNAPKAGRRPAPEADCHARRFATFATFSSPFRQGMVARDMRARLDRAFIILGASARKKDI
jgi:hypothetical protein